MQFTTDFVDVIKASEFVRRLQQDHVVVMDNTEFTNWNPCFVKGMLFGAHRKINARNASPLIFGQAIHTGLKFLLCGSSLDEAVEAAVQDAKNGKLDEMMDPKRNSQTVREMLIGYHAHVQIMPAERLVPLELNGEKIVEKNFQMPLGKITFKPGKVFDKETDVEIWWSGVIDLMNYIGPGIWITDHKTTSVMGEKFVDDKLRSSQMLGYYHVGTEMAKQLGKPIEGVLINALAHRSSGFEFKQFKLPMAKWKVQEWHTETLLAISNLIENLCDFLVSGEAVPNREQCVSKYGRCQYFDVCEQVPTVRDRLLSTPELYKDNAWNPNE